MTDLDEKMGLKISKVAGFLIIALAPFAALAFCVERSVASNETPPSSSVCGDIQATIDQAIEEGTPRIELPAGAVCESGPLVIAKADGLIVEGRGAKVQFRDHGRPGLRITEGSKNIHLRNFTIDYKNLPFTQGVVTAVDGSEFAFRIEGGYPSLIDLGRVDRAYLFDARTRLWKPGVSTLYFRNLEPGAGGRSGKIALTVRYAGVVKVGDLIAFAPRGPAAINIDGLAGNVTVEGVTINSSPGMGIMTRFATGHNRFQFKVDRGAPPLGAKVSRLLSTNSDAFNYAYSRVGPTIESSFIAGQGDDGVNLHALVLAATGRDSQGIVLSRPFGGGAVIAKMVNPGDVVQFLAKDTFAVLGRATVTNFVEIKDSRSISDEDMQKMYPRSRMVAGRSISNFHLKVDGNIPPNVGYVDFPSLGAQGFIIRDTTFEDSRGHAIVSAVSEGIIERNIVRRLTQNGIVIGPSYDPWREGGWVKSVTVRDNHIEQTCLDPTTLTGPEAWASGAISITAHLPQRIKAKSYNEDIILSGNKFYNHMCSSDEEERLSWN